MVLAWQTALDDAARTYCFLEQREAAEKVAAGDKQAKWTVQVGIKNLIERHYARTEGCLDVYRTFQNLRRREGETLQEFSLKVRAFAVALNASPQAAKATFTDGLAAEEQYLLTARDVMADPDWTIDKVVGYLERCVGKKRKMEAASGRQASGGRTAVVQDFRKGN